MKHTVILANNPDTHPLNCRSLETIVLPYVQADQAGDDGFAL